MSDREAIAIAQEFQEAAVELANAFHADAYELLKATRVRNEYSEWVDTWASAGESGYCALLVVNQASGRRVEGDIVLSETVYEVEIKPPTSITTANRIQINGRLFDVTDVKRGGEMEMFVTASLEEPGDR